MKYGLELAVNSDSDFWFNFYSIRRKKFLFLFSSRSTNNFLSFLAHHHKAAGMKIRLSKNIASCFLSYLVLSATLNIHGTNYA